MCSWPGHDIPEEDMGDQRERGKWGVEHRWWLQKLNHLQRREREREEREEEIKKIKAKAKIRYWTRESRMWLRMTGEWSSTELGMTNRRKQIQREANWGRMTPSFLTTCLLGGVFLLKNSKEKSDLGILSFTQQGKAKSRSSCRLDSNRDSQELTGIL